MYSSKNVSTSIIERLSVELNACNQIEAQLKKSTDEIRQTKLEEQLVLRCFQLLDSAENGYPKDNLQPYPAWVQANQTRLTQLIQLLKSHADKKILLIEKLYKVLNLNNEPIKYQRSTPLFVNYAEPNEQQRIPSHIAQALYLEIDARNLSYFLVGLESTDKFKKALEILGLTVQEISADFFGGFEISISHQHYLQIEEITKKYLLSFGKNTLLALQKAIDEQGKSNLIPAQNKFYSSIDPIPLLKILGVNSVSLVNSFEFDNERDKYTILASSQEILKIREIYKKYNYNAASTEAKYPNYRR